MAKRKDTPLPFKDMTQNFHTTHFHKHFISQNFVTWSQPAKKEVKNLATPVLHKERECIVGVV